MGRPAHFSFAISLRSYMNITDLSFVADRGLINPAITGDVSVITSLLGYDRGAAAYVQSLGLKAVAVVLLRLYHPRSPEQDSFGGFFFKEV